MLVLHTYLHSCLPPFMLTSLHTYLHLYPPAFLHTYLHSYLASPILTYLSSELITFLIPACLYKIFTDNMSGERSPRPVFVGRSILKPSTTPTASFAVRDPAPCAGPPNLVGRGLCKASKEVYAAPWRMGPAQEWATETLPIERSDRFLSVGVRQRRLALATNARQSVVVSLLTPPSPFHHPSASHILVRRLTSLFYLAVWWAPGNGCQSFFEVDAHPDQLNWSPSPSASSEKKLSGDLGPSPLVIGVSSCHLGAFEWSLDHLERSLDQLERSLDLEPGFLTSVTNV